MSKLFLGGVPTAPDVKKLRKAFPELVDGQDISHEEVESVLNMDSRSSRYRSVTTAWRKEMLNEENIEVSAVAGVGFRCLTGPERLSTNIKGFRAGTRKQGKSIRRVTMVPAEKLGEQDQAKQLHLMRLGSQIVQQAASVMKQIEAPKSQEQLTLLRKPSNTPSA